MRALVIPSAHLSRFSDSASVAGAAIIDSTTPCPPQRAGAFCCVKAADGSRPHPLHTGVEKPFASSKRSAPSRIVGPREIYTEVRAPGAVQVASPPFKAHTHTYASLEPSIETRTTKFHSRHGLWKGSEGGTWRTIMMAGSGCPLHRSSRRRGRRATQPQGSRATMPRPCCPRSGTRGSGTTTRR